jgi:hypothetical protein
VQSSVVTSEGLVGFEVVRQLGFQYQVVIAPKRTAGTEIDTFKWINVLLGDLKITLFGTHHVFKIMRPAI